MLTLASYEGFPAGASARSGLAGFFGRIIGRKLLEKIEAASDQKLKDEMLEEFCYGVNPLICPPIDPAHVKDVAALLDKLAALREAKGVL